MNKSIARKEISRIKENGKETIVNEYIEFEMDKGIRSSFYDLFEDYEYAQEHGVYYDLNDDILFIRVNFVLDELNDRLIDRSEDEITCEKILIDFLSQYKGYDIWF